MRSPAQILGERVLALLAHGNALTAEEIQQQVRGEQHGEDIDLIERELVNLADLKMSASIGGQGRVWIDTPAGAAWLEGFEASAATRVCIRAPFGLRLSPDGSWAITGPRRAGGSFAQPQDAADFLLSSGALTERARAGSPKRRSSLAEVLGETR